MRFKRAGTLVVYWQDEQLVFHNYAQRSTVQASFVTMEILNFFNDWQTTEAAAAFFDGYSAASIAGAVAELLDGGLLIAEATPAALQDQAIGRDWAPWLPEASFHFSSKDAAYVHRDSPPELKQSSLPITPPPPFFKSIAGATAIALPTPAMPLQDFGEVLLRRRTHRKFSAQAVALADIAQLLSMVWGVKGYIDTPTFGKLPLKTSPSGGARHPGEVYLMALRVEGLAPGIYHYHPVDHTLSLVNGQVSPERAASYCADQRYVGDAAALFLMTAMFPRTMWKYHKPRAYRVVLLDTGHLGQTFCLLATALGLAPFGTAALKDTLIEHDLGIDGVNESAMYVTGVGHRRTNAA
ncbi:SagB family peptide dehydrogenase [Chitinimonas arctica]|nr:SagB family peptide dehydrogenase [Chitinimonas arctica]